MTSSLDAAIISITLTVNGRTGLTLWAPPWQDEDGEDWQGFLGDGAKILLYPNSRELADFVASGEENDLSDHPGWGYICKQTPDGLRPASEDAYNLDQVYEWAAGEPDPVRISNLANVVDMVAKIADCCDDGALRRLVENTPAYEELVDEEVSYQGKDGRKRWSELGDVIADSWERAIGRVESWLSWQGDFSDAELEAETVWDRVGALPIQIVLPDATYCTVRGEVGEDAEGNESRTVFLGADDTVAVFAGTPGLAQYCRTAEEHELRKLEWWSELKDVEDDEVFAPGPEDTYDLRKPSARGADLLRELAQFCGMQADTALLEGDIDKNTDKDDWNDLVTEVQTCLQQQD